MAACARYAPLGERGMYGFGPHTEYQTLPPGEHMAAANARVHVTVMLETKRAFDRLDEIAAVPGIDALTIGPTDLAQDLGVLGTPAQRPTLAEYRQRLVAAARKHGKALAMLTDSVEGVREMVDARRDHHQLLLRRGRAPGRLRRDGGPDPERPMKRSTERILTTHTGSLPRPADLTATLEALDAGTAPDPARLRRACARRRRRDRRQASGRGR